MITFQTVRALEHSARDTPILHTNTIDLFAWNILLHTHSNHHRLSFSFSPCTKHSKYKPPFTHNLYQYTAIYILNKHHHTQWPLECCCCREPAPRPSPSRSPTPPQPPAAEHRRRVRSIVCPDKTVDGSAFSSHRAPQPAASRNSISSINAASSAWPAPTECPRTPRRRPTRS